MVIVYFPKNNPHMVSGLGKLHYRVPCLEEWDDSMGMLMIRSVRCTLSEE